MAKWRETIKKLKVPYYPDDDRGGEMHYEVKTMEEKTVCDYTGYVFKELEDMEVLENWLLLKDAIVYNYMQTEEGREYLDNCWRMEQTEPDRKLLRKKMGDNWHSFFDILIYI